jgi:hypothetical protein
MNQANSQAKNPPLDERPSSFALIRYGYARNMICLFSSQMLFLGLNIGGGTDHGKRAFFIDSMRNIHIMNA